MHTHCYCLEGKTVCFLIESGKFMENDLRALQAWGKEREREGLHTIRTQVRTKSKRFQSPLCACCEFLR